MEVEFERVRYNCDSDEKQYRETVVNHIVFWYYVNVIKTFANADTEKVYFGQSSRRYPSDIQRNAQRKLMLVHSAGQIEDLELPPGNRLEKLSGDRAGQWSIRINLKWRVCFDWEEENAYEVEIVDYH